MVPWDHRGVMVGLAIVIICALLNIAGVRAGLLYLAVASGGSFLAVRVDGVSGALEVRSSLNAVTTPTTSNVDMLGGLLICMWNYMGWDNASTIATEVERPQRTYPRAMLGAVAIIALTYIVPSRPFG